MSKKIRKILNFHCEWLKKNFNRIVERESSKAAECLQAGDPNEMKVLTDVLNTLGVAYGINGITKIYNNDKSGWKFVHLGAEYHYCAVRCRYYTYKNLPSSANLSNYFSLAACLGGYAIFTGKEAWKKELTAFLDEGIQSNLEHSSYWTGRVFEPFIRLLLKETDVYRFTSQIKPKELGIYGEMIEHWDDSVAMEKLLNQACVYHCSNMEDVDERDPEFDTPPFDLIPFEIGAIQRIRKEMSLPPILVTHPIAEFLSGHEADEIVSDELLNDVIDLISARLLASRTCDWEDNQDPSSKK